MRAQTDLRGNRSLTLVIISVASSFLQMTNGKSLGKLAASMVIKPSMGLITQHPVLLEKIESSHRSSP